MRSRIFLPFVAIISMIAVVAVAQNKTGDAKAGANQQSKPAASAQAGARADDSSIEKRVEDFLRNWYAWGPEFQVKVGPVSQAPASELLEVPVLITADQGSEQALVYVTKDGHFMFRGDIQDLTVDPIAETRSHLHLDNYASKGPADAKIVLVEFGDFECPSCRQLDFLLRDILPKYPQVRLVFKDYPLESIHPWAMTAAIAGHCALQQSSDIFWKFHDSVYDNQDLISPENAFEKLTDLGVQSGVNKDKFQACRSDSKTQELIHASMDEGRSLQVTGTPTTFVNGRRLVGPDQPLLEQYLHFDLSALPVSK
jgi:protein-disulfide isomerase